MATTTTATTTSDPATTTTDGPVLTVITKRLRALRKKLNRISLMEHSLSQGKSLNSEQLHVLRSKPSVLAAIDELEKLRSPLSAAVTEELSAVNSSVNSSVPSNGNNGIEEMVEDLVRLMYFGNLFNVRTQSEYTSLMLTRTHERGCCLTYDYVTDDDDDSSSGGGLLGEKDLDLISALRELIVSKPVHSVLSHRSALDECARHARLWIDKSDSPIGDSDSNVTYAGLREKLNKIMASDYFTATPQVKGPGEVAAAAAVGNFGSFEVSLHEPEMAVEVPVQVEESAEQYQETEENVANGEQYEAVEEHSNAVQEFHKDDLEPENPSEVVSVEADQEKYQEQFQAESGGGQRSADMEEQQYVPRRGGHRGGRGGRRGGYPNGGRGGRGSGRGGGGPYQNGRGQYYDNYYPRNNNYYNNRRGGRGGGGGSGGGGGGGNTYHNQGNYSQANAGVAS